MSSTGYPAISSIDPQDVQSLKRSYVSLKGWITRKGIQISSQHRIGAHPVEYQGRFMITRVWFTSPNGIADADLVRRYLETKVQLKKLGEL